MRELLTCPFCGGDAVYDYEEDINGHFVECAHKGDREKCPVHPMVSEFTKEASFAAWNRRAALSAPASGKPCDRCEDAAIAASEYRWDELYRDCCEANMGWLLGKVAESIRASCRHAPTQTLPAVEPASEEPYVPHITAYGEKSQAPFLTPKQLGMKEPASGRRELFRPATRAENLLLLLAHQSDHLSPAEKHELREAAAALSEAGERWIPVSERLPKADEHVLFVDEYRAVSVGCKALDDDNSNQWIDKTATDRDGDYLDTYTVTHWMPIPAAPAQEEGKE